MKHIKLIILLFLIFQGCSKKTNENNDESNVSEKHTVRNFEEDDDNKYEQFCSDLGQSGNFHAFIENHGFIDYYGLSVHCNDSKVMVDFFGPSPEGEHGMFYFIADIENFIIKDSNKFRIIGKKGTLYEDSISFSNLEEFESLNGSGFDKTDFSLDGTIINKDSIYLACKTKYKFDCFIDTLLFSRYN